MLTLVSVSGTAQARQAIIPAPPQVAATAYLLIDADTGKVIIEHNADEQLPPASLTKMMTSYIVSSEIEEGRLQDEDLVRISDNAWRKGGSASGSSTMFLNPRTEVPVIDLMRGVIIQSGNDASIALAEHVAGDESAFADVMNQQATLLGMNHTTFKNATGWPQEGHLTTARDLSILAKALINDFPDHYKLYSEKYYEYNGHNQANRNKLLFRDSSVDGLKTGHTNEAGYCLVASAKKDGMRLISVVMGTRSMNARAVESQKLLSYGFRYFETHKLYDAGNELSKSRIWGGRQKEVSIGVKDDLFLTIPRGSAEELDAQMHIDEVIKAPVTQGQELGNLTVVLDDETLVDVPLVAIEAVEQAGFFARLWDSIKLFILGLFS
ncbi:D-alanyl-D-alanine carboxypeptidase family protein [Pseudomaricurvus hydrocarbonicus]